MGLFKKEYLVKFEYNEFNKCFAGEVKIYCLPYRIHDIKNELLEMLNNIGNKAEDLRIVEITQI